MGNCFKASSSDHFSLLRDADETEVNEPSRNVQIIQRPDSQLVHRPSGSFTSGGTIGTSSHSTAELSESEQVRVAKRLGLIHHLPSRTYDGSKKARECVICMNEFVIGDCLRYLPCLHIYHRECIDDWLMRSFTCPSCLEPVDAALLMTYQN